VGRAAVWAVVKEAEFEKWVMAVAEANGWCGHHNRKSIGSVSGVHHVRQHGHDDAYGALDWQFWNRAKRRYMQRELKTMRGTISRHQRRVVADLQACGVDAKVWRPCDEAEIRETFAA
jgi:hypothetical protein